MIDALPLNEIKADTEWENGRGDCIMRLALEATVPGSWFLVKPGGEDSLRDEVPPLPPGQPDLPGVHARAWRFLPTAMVSQ